MSTAQAGIVSEPPKMKVDKGNPEALKYGAMWEKPEYRIVSPGEEWVGLFLARCQPHRNAHIIDFGCGTGRASLKLATMGYKVTMVDFVNNSLDQQVRDAMNSGQYQLEFLKHDLEKPLPIFAEFGICADVMEHIPTMRVDKVIGNALKAAQHVFFGICTEDDACGDLIGETLHMTVRPYSWWLKKIALQDAVVHWSIENKRHAIFFCSNWREARELSEKGVRNVEDEQVRENVRHNIAQGYQQVQPYKSAEGDEFFAFGMGDEAPESMAAFTIYPASDRECIILGGGPSLPDFIDDIRDKRAAGIPIVTMNGTYNWALEHGLKPSAQVVVDARPFNARFVKPVIEKCKYILSSQCHPSVFEGLPKEQILIWQTNAKLIADLMDAQYGAKKWTTVPGGTTVLVRTIPLLRMLGYRRFHLYGCDSCLKGDAHHAYSQPENDKKLVVPCIVTGGRIFWCNPWMVAQAADILDQIRTFGDYYEIEVYGDGLIAHMLRTGAEMEDAEKYRAIKDMMESYNRS